MKFSSLKRRAMLGAAVALFPAAALAQDNTLEANVATGTTVTNTTTTTVDPAMNMTGADPLADNMAATDPMMTDPAVNTMVVEPVVVDPNVATTDEYAQVRQEDDDDFPWGLLGLLGLAGLLGRGKKHDTADIHVDARDGRR